MVPENGQLIYHYTSRSAAFERIVPTGSLRLSSLATMRDPVENKDWVERLLVPVAWPATDAERLERLTASTLHTTKILSFTLDRALTTGVLEAYAWGWARPRMWEQYAENHQGVCLAFDRSVMHERMLQSLRAVNDDAFDGEVIYSDGPLPGHVAARSITATQLLVDGDGDAERGLRAHVRGHIEELFFRKLEDWETEKEFRYVLLDDNDEDVIVPVAGLRAVIVGERFPEWQLAGAAEVCARAGAELLKTSWSGPPQLQGVDDASAAR